MTTFEVTIDASGQLGNPGPSAGESAPLRLLVAADNWVAAWQEGLRVIGVNELPADSLCVVGDDGRVDVEVPTLQRRFQMRQLLDHQGPQPIAGKPLLLAKTGYGEAKIQVLAATKNPKLFRRPLARHPSADPLPAADSDLQTAPTPPPTKRPPGTVKGPTPDPIARILSELERQRLLSRPVRISSQTGLPTREMRRGGREREITPSTVPRMQPTTDEKRRPRGDPTSAFVVAQTELLPQQFHPVQAEAQPGEEFDIALQWAAATAWHHVPCAMALVLECDDEGRFAEVVASRGEQEREVRGCRVACDGGPTQLGRAPSLMRLSAERPLRVSRRDGSTWDLSVSSVLSVPVELADGELTGLGLVLLNATRASGFTDSELRAVAYLARTLATRIS